MSNLTRLAKLVKNGVIDPDFIFTEKPDIRHVYVVEANGLFKIGYATSPARRIASMNCGSPVRVTLLLSIPTDEYSYLEAVLHAKFQDRHHHGEWFALTPQDIALIRASVKTPSLLADVSLVNPRTIKARQMRRAGASCNQIAVELNVSKSTASRLYSKKR